MLLFICYQLCVFKNQLKNTISNTISNIKKGGYTIKMTEMLDKFKSKHNYNNNNVLVSEFTMGEFLETEAIIYK